MAQTQRTYVELSDEKRAQIKRWQEQIKEELPDLAIRLRKATKAAEENTFSGELRRAIHASGLTLNYIADGAGTTPIVLDQFLIGEGTLQSDVIDRVAGLIGCELVEAEKANSKELKAFVTYENYRDPHVTIHRAGCSQIKKRGGEHKHRQGGYKEHDSFRQAEEYANSTGMQVKRCSFCDPEHAQSA
jgi:hypothetical protein